MKRPQMRRGWRDILLIVWLVAVLSLLPGIEGAEPSRADDGKDLHGEARNVPVDQLRRRVEAGQLSLKPARWSEVLESGQQTESVMGRLPAPIRRVVRPAGPRESGKDR